MTKEEFKKIVLEEEADKIVEVCPDEFIDDSAKWDNEMIEAYAKKIDRTPQETRDMIDESWLCVAREDYEE